MSQSISIDPVSRIAGHCHVDLELDGRTIRQASISGTMWRGIERVVVGRPVADAWLYAQRICGACAPAHAIASIRATESAYGAEVAVNAQTIRNAIIAAHAVAEHVATFYQRALPDWISTPATLAVDPATAASLARAIAPATPVSELSMRRLQERLRADAARGTSVPFRAGASADLDPSHALVLIAHAIEARRAIRAAGSAIAMLAGKLPHIQSLAIGGVATAISLDDPATLSMTRMHALSGLFDDMLAFVGDLFMPDVVALAAAMPAWLQVRSRMTLLALPDMPTDAASTTMTIPGGVLAPDSGFEAIDPVSVPALVARMTLTADRSDPVARSVRLDGRPAEVGAAAQVLTARAAGHSQSERWLRAAAAELAGRGGPTLEPEMLQSPMGRHIARAIRAGIMAELGTREASALIERVGQGDTTIRIAPPSAATGAKGIGHYESPHGTLVHTLSVGDDAVEEYSVIAPDTWNIGPRGADRSAGPCEAALVGVALRDASEPVEALRTMQSFAPCMSCASA